MIPDETKPPASMRYWRAWQFVFRIPALYLKRRKAVERASWLGGESLDISWEWAVRHFHLWVWGRA